MTVHIYSQRRSADDTWIVGTRDDLLKLRAAIDAALAPGKGSKRSAASETFADAKAVPYTCHVKIVVPELAVTLLMPDLMTANACEGDPKAFTPELVPTE